MSVLSNWKKRLVAFKSGSYRSCDMSTINLHSAQEVLTLQPGDTLRGRSEEESLILRTVADWSRDHIGKLHPDLGRDGPICPFVEMSIRKNQFLLTLEHTVHSSQEAIRGTVLRYRDIFLQLEPWEGNDSLFKTILILLPDVQPDEAANVIDGLQLSLKPQFVEDGLMIGQFHPLNNTPGMWNEDFRPLRSPIAMLVIRYMVLTDMPFLEDDTGHLAAYLRKFKEEGIARITSRIKTLKTIHQ